MQFFKPSGQPMGSSILTFNAITYHTLDHLDRQRQAPTLPLLQGIKTRDLWVSFVAVCPHLRTEVVNSNWIFTIPVAFKSSCLKDEQSSSHLIPWSSASVTICSHLETCFIQLVKTSLLLFVMLVHYLNKNSVSESQKILYYRADHAV